MVQSLLQNPRVSKRDLERFIALWACNLFPTMHSMLHYFYHDLYSPAASNYSISPDALHTLHEYLSPNLVFIATLPGTAIPLNSKLLSIRHQPLSKLSGLRAIRLTHTRLWMRISNMASSRRKLQQDSLQFLRIFEHWLLHMCPFCVMRPPACMVMEAAADARAVSPAPWVGSSDTRNWASFCSVRFFTTLIFRILGSQTSHAMRPWLKGPSFLRLVACYRAAGSASHSKL